MTSDGNVNPWARGLTWLLEDGPLADQACEVLRPNDSPWINVDKLEGGEKVPPRFAIWRRTGAVHRVQEEGEPYPGAVEDEPIWQP